MQLSSWLRPSGRYKARTEERLAAERALGERGILHADRPERVRRRLARLVAPTTPVAIAEAGPPSADLIGLKRLIGVNNFIDARFLRIGVAVARTVARIVVKDASWLILKYGTGFLVARGLLLTNHHVLDTPARPATGSARVGADGRCQFASSPAWCSSTVIGRSSGSIRSATTGPRNTVRSRPRTDGPATDRMRRPRPVSRPRRCAIGLPASLDPDPLTPALIAAARNHDQDDHVKDLPELVLQAVPELDTRESSCTVPVHA